MSSEITKVRSNQGLNHMKSLDEPKFKQKNSQTAIIDNVEILHALAFIYGARVYLPSLARQVIRSHGYHTS
jgi:hypothetical protein